MNTSIGGGCLCGKVRYRATGEDVARSLCHCRTCRHASGAPSVAWVVFRADDFAFVGDPPSRFSSSPGVVRTFCGNCGTPLTYQRTAQPQTIDVTTATLDTPDAFAPTKEIWLEHRLPWESVNEALEHYARSSVGASPIDG
ncbi:MAG: GFA family protein [Gemmatimonadetes bacterium]|nr:GFA family protein [Gemmatimonadota bacterium]